MPVGKRKRACVKDAGIPGFPYGSKPMVYDMKFEAWYQGKVMDSTVTQVMITYPGWYDNYDEWIHKTSDRFDYCTGGRKKWKQFKGVKGAFYRLIPPQKPCGALRDSFPVEESVHCSPAVRDDVENSESDLPSVSHLVADDVTSRDDRSAAYNRGLELSKRQRKSELQDSQPPRKQASAAPAVDVKPSDRPVAGHQHLSAPDAGSSKSAGIGLRTEASLPLVGSGSMKVQHSVAAVSEQRSDVLQVEAAAVLSALGSSARLVPELVNEVPPVSACPPASTLPARRGLVELLQGSGQASVSAAFLTGNSSLEPEGSPIPHVPKAPRSKCHYTMHSAPSDKGKDKRDPTTVGRRSVADGMAETTDCLLALASTSALAEAGAGTEAAAEEGAQRLLNRRKQSQPARTGLPGLAVEEGAVDHTLDVIKVAGAPEQSLIQQLVAACAKQQEALAAAAAAQTVQEHGAVDLQAAASDALLAMALSGTPFRVPPFATSPEPELALAAGPVPDEQRAASLRKLWQQALIEFQAAEGLAGATPPGAPRTAGDIGGLEAAADEPTPDYGPEVLNWGETRPRSTMHSAQPPQEVIDAAGRETSEKLKKAQGQVRLLQRLNNEQQAQVSQHQAEVKRERALRVKRVRELEAEVENLKERLQLKDEATGRTMSRMALLQEEHRNSQQVNERLRHDLDLAKTNIAQVSEDADLRAVQLNGVINQARLLRGKLEGSVGSLAALATTGDDKLAALYQQLAESEVMNRVLQHRIMEFWKVAKCVKANHAGAWRHLKRAFTVESLIAQPFPPEFDAANAVVEEDFTSAVKEGLDCLVKEIEQVTELVDKACSLRNMNNSDWKVVVPHNSEQKCNIFRLSAQVFVELPKGTVVCAPHECLVEIGSQTQAELHVSGKETGAVVYTPSDRANVPGSQVKPALVPGVVHRTKHAVSTARRATARHAQMDDIHSSDIGGGGGAAAAASHAKSSADAVVNRQPVSEQPMQRHTSESPLHRLSMEFLGNRHPDLQVPGHRPAAELSQRRPSEPLFGCHGPDLQGQKQSEHQAHRQTTDVQLSWPFADSPLSRGAIELQSRSEYDQQLQRQEARVQGQRQAMGGHAQRQAADAQAPKYVIESVTGATKQSTEPGLMRPPALSTFLPPTSVAASKAAWPPAHHLPAAADGSWVFTEQGVGSAAGAGASSNPSQPLLVQMSQPMLQFIQQGATSLQLPLHQNTAPGQALLGPGIAPMLINGLQFPQLSQLPFRVDPGVQGVPGQQMSVITMSAPGALKTVSQGVMQMQPVVLPPGLPGINMGMPLIMMAPRGMQVQRLQTASATQNAHSSAHASNNSALRN